MRLDYVLVYVGWGFHYMRFGRFSCAGFVKCMSLKCSPRGCSVSFVCSRSAVCCGISVVLNQDQVTVPFGVRGLSVLYMCVRVDFGIVSEAAEL